MSLFVIEKNGSEKSLLKNKNKLKPTSAAVNSMNDKTGDEMGDLLSWINKPFNTLNNEDVNAAKVPSKIPNPNCISAEKIRKMAPIIIIPINSSYHINFLLYKIGSTIAVKNVPVLKAASVTETLETLIPP